MEDLSWSIEPDTGMGTRATSIAVNAAAGVPFRVVQQFSVSDETLDVGNDYTYTHDLVPPPVTAGFLLVHLTFLSPINQTIGHTPILTYAGENLLADIAVTQIQSATHKVFDVVGYLFLGDLSSFSGSELVVDLSSYLNLSVGLLGLNVEVFDGIDQDTAPLTEDTFVTINTYVSPLTFTPSPSTDYDIVFTTCCAARTDSETDVVLALLENAGYAQLENVARQQNGVIAEGYFFCDVGYNCECEVDPEARTLLELRTDLLPLAGYAAQIINPPPGIANLMNLYLRQSQNYLYTKYKALETERFFSWTLTPGIRYYGLRDNRNCCDVALNKYRITGAWLQDLNNVWWPLIEGIDPTFYTLNVNFGWPAYYQVRQCIEIFPAPQAAYTLWLRGHFNLLPLTDDADVTTIAADPVLNYAVFLAKSAKGAADAAIYSKMAAEQVGYLISGAHGTRRYIPGTSEIPVPTPPVMVHFDA